MNTEERRVLTRIDVFRWLDTLSPAMREVAEDFMTGSRTRPDKNDFRTKIVLHRLAIAAGVTRTCGKCGETMSAAGFGWNAREFCLQCEHTSITSRRRQYEAPLGPEWQVTPYARVRASLPRKATPRTPRITPPRTPPRTPRVLKPCGTRAAYRRGCRCDECYAARREYDRNHEVRMRERAMNDANG